MMCMTMHISTRTRVHALTQPVHIYPMQVPHYNEALDMILDIERMEETPSEDRQAKIESSAEYLYGLVRVVFVDEHACVHVRGVCVVHACTCVRGLCARL